MSSIILPSSTVSHLQRPFKSKAYPFKAKRFGSGGYAKGRKPIRGADPRTYSPYKYNTSDASSDVIGGSIINTDFFPDATGKTPKQRRDEQIEMRRKALENSSTPKIGSGESGSGYFGPTGWVNTQPIQAQAEYTPEQARMVGRYNSTNTPNRPRNPAPIKSQANQINAIKKMIHRDKVRNRYRKSASHIQRLLAKLLGATQ